VKCYSYCDVSYQFSNFHSFSSVYEGCSNETHSCVQPLKKAPKGPKFGLNKDMKATVISKCQQHPRELFVQRNFSHKI
jgi:hypothetical protein